jgi:two-component system chemotaxis response regulator CheY
MMNKDMVILVIEDNAEAINLLYQDLREVGFTGQVYMAENGSEGLQIVKNNLGKKFEVEFIICDINMPVMNGFEFLQNLNELQGVRQLPCLMLSSRDDYDAITKCSKFGATNYLLKPWTKQTLLDKVSSCLEKTLRK